MESPKSFYDEDSTIFSPDGRLFQVEYARETVKKGATTIGLKFKDGVVLIGCKDVPSRLVETDSMDKISEIDNHVGCAFVGLSADARHLVDYARDESQINNIWYDEQMKIQTLVTNICEYKHLFTQFYGVRPFGVVLFVAGIDETGINLFATDPSGAYLGYKAVCEGKNSDKIISYIDHYYKPDLTLEKAIDLGLQAIKKATKKKLDAKSIEIAAVEKNKTFRKLSNEEIKNKITRSK
jgi:proteasome alpha subunit